MRCGPLLIFFLLPVVLSGCSQASIERMSSSRATLRATNAESASPRASERRGSYQKGWIKQNGVWVEKMLLVQG
ncbi:MAG: hypothetical protein RIR26_810 [Pseudomonadota bacterium]